MVFVLSAANQFGLPAGGDGEIFQGQSKWIQVFS